MQPSHSTDPAAAVADAATAVRSLMAAHRSIRQYKADPVDDTLIDTLLQEALHGGSSSGNLNMVSVVKTREPDRRQQLYELHGQQPMILQAPLLLTFCADTHRTRTWLAQRGARLGFDDLVAWHVASFDAMILAQTMALALQAHGLGICYMGTTLFAMRRIAALLELPQHCLPVTTMVVGWPGEAPAQRDRLPSTAWIHNERYQAPTADDIERDFGQRDVRGWARYRAMGPEMTELMAAHGITSLAQFYTSKIKYDPDVLGAFSVDLQALLTEHGFLHKNLPSEQAVCDDK